MKLTSLLFESTYIFLQPVFMNDISDWVNNPNKSTAQKLLKYKGEIPRNFKKPSILYRGLNLSEIDYRNLQSGKSIIQLGPRSWSHKKDIAKKFISSREFQISNNSSKPYKILIRKEIDSSSILIDIYHYFLYAEYATDFNWDEIVKDSILKEQEVLCFDVGISKSDIIGRIA